ncbi:hypothetical protein SEA_BARNSTORMER_46 [Microbacterium phage Barnstormer]|uniref:Uncharacterized protein n=1 Tax=Microbacterium phage Barnstormer TaxID=3028491 RepID=A0AAF0CJT8_9CAUD|nr:hypothetical protein SEA_BARNSTORMER_46 [Microbacterium phage Barnstormer]
MPNVRVCPVCQVPRTPDEFREPAERGMTGRPPKVCAGCRAVDPELQAVHADNVTRRDPARQRQRGYARRSEAERLAATRATHPAGIKRCPDVAGCGRALPVGEFYVDPYQQDGLRALCSDCSS